MFLVGSDDDVVNGEAAEEAAQYLVTYLQRLQVPVDLNTRRCARI